MGAIEAVEFIKSDHGDVVDPGGFRKTFAEDRPYMSILQRNKKTLEQVLELFKWQEDDAEWTKEYNKEKDGKKISELVKYRRRVYFDICGWREFNEDFGRCDVSCMREIRTPLVTSRSQLKAMYDEFIGA